MFFLVELQNTMTDHYPPPTRHNSLPLLKTLMEELLLTRYVLSFQLPPVEGTGHPTSCRPLDRLNL
jgi:hypothetical protein